MFDDRNGRVNRNNCEKGFHIIGCNTLTFLKADGFDMVNECLYAQYNVGNVLQMALRCLLTALLCHM